MSAITIDIPTDLRRPHPLVTATREAAVGLKPREDGRIEIGPRRGVAHVVVTREHLRRALLLLHAIATEATRRGHEIESVEKDSYGHRAGIAVVIRTHSYTIEISELSDRVPLSAAEITAWVERHNRHRSSWQSERKAPTTKAVANGRLRISLPSRWPSAGARCNWSEGRLSLERQLPSLFDELERRATEDDRRALERAQREQEKRRLEAERLERQHQQRIEDARVARLSEEISSWRLAQDTREYIVALRARLPHLEAPDRHRVEAWCNWAEEWSDRSDSTINVGRIRGLDDDHDRLFWLRQ